jgi:hypothetical protein
VYGQRIKLSYPDPMLSDGLVLLRRWVNGDLDCVREAATDAAIPAGTTVPAVSTPEEGLAFISRQRQRIENGEGVSLAISDASTGRVCGLNGLGVRPARSCGRSTGHGNPGEWIEREPTEAVGEDQRWSTDDGRVASGWWGDRRVATGLIVNQDASLCAVSSERSDEKDVAAVLGRPEFRTSSTLVRTLCRSPARDHLVACGSLACVQ